MPYVVADSEVEYTAIRAQGPGGQHVNTSSTAVQLRFNVGESNLPDEVKARFLALRDSRINADGVCVIKAQGTRSQLANKADALARLQQLVASAEHVAPTRRATKPSYGAKQRRLEGKAQRSDIKVGRAKVVD